MLLFSNRQFKPATGGAAEFGAAFEPMGEQLSFAAVDDNGVIGSPDADLTDAEALEQLLGVFEQASPVLVYVHGFNNTAGSMIKRCIKLQNTYQVKVVGFTWPAEGYPPTGEPLATVPVPTSDGEDELARIERTNLHTGPIRGLMARYSQAKANGQQSTHAFARFLRLLGTARLHANQRPFSIAIHSLGNHLLERTLVLPGAAEGLGTAENVALLCACVQAAGHKQWLARVRPNGRTYVTFHKADHVLTGARVADGTIKLGCEPGPDLLLSPTVRYISFDGAQADFMAHRYFIENLSPRSKALFRDIFTSRPDIGEGERPEDTYLFGCQPDGSVCYMGEWPGSPLPG
jgi:hypothetical protein